jgi:hypothetical protein
MQGKFLCLEHYIWELSSDLVAVDCSDSVLVDGVWKGYFPDIALSTLVLSKLVQASEEYGHLFLISGVEVRDELTRLFVEYSMYDLS